MACLLVFNAVFTGLVAGAAAANEPATIFCSIGAGGDAADAPGPMHYTGCCDMGCGPTAPALPASPVAAPEAPAEHLVGIALPRLATATPPASVPGTGPRGPPILA